MWFAIAIKVINVINVMNGTRALNVIFDTEAIHNINDITCIRVTHAIRATHDFDVVGRICEVA